MFEVGSYILAVVLLCGTQNTRPSGSRTPPTKEADPGNVTDGVMVASRTEARDAVCRMARETFGHACEDATLQLIMPLVPNGIGVASLGSELPRGISAIRDGISSIPSFTGRLREP